MTAGDRLLEVNLIVMPSVGDVDGELMPRLMDFAYRSRRKKPAALDLLVADDAEMARLNRRHLGKDEPTDVLSFEDGEDEKGRVRLGDIAIGAETARRVAAERGCEYRVELAFYALHGLFHLLGMDDARDADRARMLHAQARAIRDFGLDSGRGLEWNF